MCGGGASLYRQWAALAGPQVHVCPVQLPGRENQIAESPFQSLDLLLSALDDALSPFLDMPCAIFEHSLRALIGFELARRFAERKGLVPVHFFASSCRAPSVRLRLRVCHPRRRSLLRSGIWAPFPGPSWTTRKPASSHCRP